MKFWTYEKNKKMLKIMKRRSSSFLKDIYASQTKSPSNYAMDENTKQYLHYDWSLGCWGSIDMKTVALNLGDLNVQRTSFENFNQKKLDNFTFYLSKQGCALIWDNSNDSWSFKQNYSNDLEFIHRIRPAFYMKDHLYSFGIPDISETNERYEKLKESVLNDSSKDLAENLIKHLPAMCPLLSSFLKSRFAYYENEIVEKEVVNYLVNLLNLIHKKSLNNLENSSNVPQKIHAFIGPGQSGKSTFSNFIGNLATEGGVKTTSMAVLSNDTRFETFYWLGKAVIMIPEVEDLASWKKNLGFLKSISGHDLVPYEVKFGVKGQARVSGLLILTSNQPITASTKSEYISQYRRLVNIFFNESIPKDKAEPNFSEKLSEEIPLFIIFCHFLQTFETKGF
jgi:hypothetical protein